MHLYIRSIYVLCLRGEPGQEAATVDLLYKKILKNFAIFTGKHLCWSLLFNKVAGWKIF